MKITTEQLYYIREKAKKLQNQIKDYKKTLGFRECFAVNESAQLVSEDSIADREYQEIRAEYREILNILSTATLIKERNTEKIDIGTKFGIIFDGEDEEETLMLVENLTGVSYQLGFISEKSLIGQSLIGKKEGDVFEYQVNSSKIKGQVTTIKKEYSDYIHFIKEKHYSTRIHKKEKERIKELNSLTDEEAILEKADRQKLTKSQKELLSIEADQLVKNAKCIESAKRLAVIRNLLKEETAIAPTDDTIGVGSIVTISYTTKDGQVKDGTYEYINRAVSSELDNEYIERISTLGNALYGLQAGDEFKIQTTNCLKPIVGYIENVSNPKTITTQKIK